MATERTTRDFFFDKAGRKVVVGDRIAYGHALGRCAGLRFGKVLAIEVVKHVYHNPEGAWAIRVQGVDDDWSFREPKLCNPGTLQFPERILLMNGLLPDGIEAMLEVRDA